MASPAFSRCPPVALALALCGCLTPVEEVDCARDSDCAPWFSCVERRCTTPSDAGMPVDAGPPTPPSTASRCATAPTSWGNIATELSATLGAGVAPLTELARPLTVTKLGDSRIAVINAQISRTGTRTENAYVIVRLKNVGQTGACFIKTSNSTYVDSNGQTVHQETLASYVQGSAATMTGSQVTTDTCLLPGQEGFLTDIVLDDDAPQFFSKTTGVRLRFAVNDNAFSHSGAFMPRSITSAPATLGSSISMVATNEATSQISFEGRYLFAMIIPLDEAGRGLPFAFLTSPSDGVIKVPACESVTLTDRYYIFDGAASRVYARTGVFDDCVGCSRAPWDWSTSAGRAAFLDQRNAREAQNEAR